VEGAQWDEAHVGTNAPGTALRLGSPVTIRAAEHFVRPVQRWSCAAAPIHDLASGRILGVVDVTGGDDIGSPQTSAMVRAAARMAEAPAADRRRAGALLPPGVRERRGRDGRRAVTAARA
jgi:transcriptional regulator of acetoin/glycerol metabolism